VFNWLFLKEGFPPVVILKADPKEYYTTLNDATNGYYKKLCILVGKAVRLSQNSLVFPWLKN
jgi:hypothetical protein